jgi:hypothetical protein
LVTVAPQLAAVSTATPISSLDLDNEVERTRQSSSDDVHRRGTDKWFSGFVNLLQQLNIWQAPGNPLRIAILDSGINFEDKEFNEEERERIKERVSFIGSSADVDAEGHGTHMAAIILRLTVNVELYIGKVTDSDVARRTPLVNVSHLLSGNGKYDYLGLCE